VLLFPAAAKFPAEEALLRGIDPIWLLLVLGEREDLLCEGELFVDFGLGETKVDGVEEAYC
jgi:hypothetical protein